MMKKIGVFIVLGCVLASCSGDEISTTENEKQDFIIETQKGSEFTGLISIEKSGQVSSSQDIQLSSNANGRIANINVKAGDSVEAGQVLATLQDNIGNYAINLERASIGVERAQINYDSSSLSLDKQIFDAETNLSKLERNLETVKKDGDQNLLQAQDNLNNSQYQNLDSKAALQIEQLDNNIEKSKLDYEIKLKNDSQQIVSYSNSLKKDFITLETFLDDLIEFSDTILGVSPVNKFENDIFEAYLGVKDITQKAQSEKALQTLITLKSNSDFGIYKSKLQQGNLTEEEIIDTIDYINNFYDTSEKLLSDLQQTLFNSTASEGQFSQSQIDTYITAVNTYQSSMQASYGVFISFGSGVKTFLETYENSQLSLQKSIELQSKDRDIQLKSLSSGELSATTGFERTVLSIEDTIKNLEDQIRIAESNLENARKNKDVSLRSLRNAIEDAQVSYASAAKEYAKLTITSPINGSISTVLIDKGQEVAMGTTLFGIVSNGDSEVEVSFSVEEKKLVEVGQKLLVSIGSNEYEGRIYAISDVADANLNYKATIVFETGTNIIGNIVSVMVPISTGKMLLPINVITTQGDGIGLVKTLSGSTFEDVRVRMGEVFGEYVEIVSCAQDCNNLNIIMTDISNYDKNKFVIQEK